jgi:ATP-dependent DNA helicase RecG
MMKTRVNIRRLMEIAIDVMRQSVHEPRTDVKASPKVGVLLLKEDGTVEKACRGELRYGDHAEYTLLERKNRSSRLDGSKLFTTLEPCAPGSRRHPKLSCAERIVLARIKEVWVGLEDPDPTVDRKGIEYLRENGIIVHMFDRDLQEIIKAENKEFVEQALDRAAEAKEKKPVEIRLSPLEDVLPAAVMNDLSERALAIYREHAGIADATGSPEFNRRLLQQGLVKKENQRLVPTGFGFLLFGKEPRKAMQQAGLLAMIEYPDGRKERREFDAPLVLIPNQLEEWLRNKLPNVFDRDRMQRREQPALPFEMVREGVVNALIHRDYAIAGAKCQLAVTEDAITIQSPGLPPPPVTMEQLQSFTAPMLSRNPILHFVFARMGMAEEQGLGIKSLKTRAESLGLPLPRFAWDDPYVVLTLYRNPEAAVHELRSDVRKAMSKDDELAWQFVAGRESVTSPELMNGLGFDERKAQRVLKKLVDLRLLRRTGKGRATKYEVSRL